MYLRVDKKNLLGSEKSAQREKYRKILLPVI